MRLIRGDCLEIMPTLDADSIDSIVTDPPYGLSFMGKDWDHGVPGEAFWCEALRVAKPGAHLLAFGGTRTFHRLAVAIEDAGWEIRDCLGWLYGSGFPKSLDVSKAIDKAAGATREVTGTRPGGYGAGSTLSRATQSAYGYRPPGEPYPGDLDGTVPITAPATPDAERWQGWGTALKPAWEPVILARKPLAGTVAANVLAHGTGGLNIDGCRIATQDTYDYPNGAGGNTFSVGRGVDGTRTKPVVSNPSGRWPANVLHDGSDEVTALFPETGVSSGGSNDGSAARFFMCCPQDEPDELFLCTAKAIMEAWKQDHAPSVAESSSLPSQSVASALSAVATWASQGEIQLSDCRVLSTNVTLSELRPICASATRLIQSTEKKYLRGSYLISIAEGSGSPVNYAAIQRLTDTTTTIPNLTSTAGSAVVVTLEDTPSNTGVGGVASASRLVYCAKASKADRDEGCETLGERAGKRPLSGGADTRGRPTPVNCNTHPTVKPTALMRYLCRLITPPGGIILDPFCGSGSTGKAAVLEGFDFIGIDTDADYLAIAEARIAAVSRQEALALA